MKEKLSSGNFIDITLTDIQTSYRLMQTVLKEFKQDGVKIDFDTDFTSFKDLFGKNADGFISGLINVVCSDSVLQLILECGQKAVYEVNGVKMKVEMASFEKEETRGDFLEVLYKIALANLKPFFPKALTR